jgi:hypothetical protein
VKRQLFNLIAVASLVACAATGALWARSFWKTDGFYRSTTHYDHFLASSHGCILINGDEDTKYGLEEFTPGSGYESLNTPYRVWSPDPTDPGLRWNYAFIGFTVAASRGALVHRGSGAAQAVVFFPAQWEISVPDWALVLLTAILPAIAVRRMRRDRHITGHCHRCGYDLRATPERCPECGTVAASAT